MRNYYLSAIFFLLFLLVGIYQSYSQTDTEFWFGVPDITCGHGGSCAPAAADVGGEPIYLRIATLELESEIRVEIGDNRVLVQPDTLIPPYTSFTIDLTPFIDELENFNYGVVEEKALHVTGSNKITAYFEEAEYYNPDIYSLKGSNALGTEFYTPFQNEWSNGNYTPQPYSGFIITATQNNTTVNLNLTSGIFNDPGGTIVLDKGETFSCVANSTAGPDHLAGSHVTSDKPIAITIYDDSSTHPAGGCRDLIGDQIVPTDAIGQEYIAMRGELNDNEKVFIVGTQDNTPIMIDSVFVDTIDAGETLSYTLTQDATHIKGFKPVYALHVSGYGCEVGGALLPTIDGCTGSYDVYITRTSTQSFFLNMMIEKTAAVNEFYIEYEDGTVEHIPDEWFVDVPNTPLGDEWVALGGAQYDGTFDGQGFQYNGLGQPIRIGIPFNEVVHIYNDGGEPFHLGFNNGGTSTGCNYGYFSDFKVVGAEVYEAGTQNPISVVCFGQTVQLTAAGGYEYTWSPASYLDDHHAQSPTVSAPPGYYPYQVRVVGGCDLDTTLDMPVQVLEDVDARFQLDTNYGCSPLEVTITNNSINEYEPYTQWTYGRAPDDTSGYMNDTTFIYTNTSDSVRTFDVQAIIQNDLGCSDRLTRSITVNPFITDSIAPDTTGCNPLQVQFRNYTTGGNLDSTTYTWEFGDGYSSNDSIPSHLFVNPTDADTTYTTVMTAESKFGCISRDTVNVTVHSYINANFTLDTIEGCSPLTIDADGQFYPGVSNYTWYFEDIDTISGAALNDPGPQTYTNLSGLSDTLEIKLVVENTGGCQDSLVREVRIHPEVTADFSPLDPPVAGCNPVRIEYVNESSYSTQPNDTAGLMYDWDFGDGNTSIQEDPIHLFSNPSYTDTTYDVSLTVTSPRGCTQDTATTVEVYSYLKADFSATHVTGCSPLTVEINDTSKGIIDHYWFWDDQALNLGSPDSLNPGGSFTKTYVNRSGQVQEKWLTLIVQNSQNCTDTLQRKITIYPEVEADFLPTDPVGCNPFTVQFTNQSTYRDTSSTTGLSYSWDFGDGGNSNLTDPEHVFTNDRPADTIFTTELIVNSLYGCADTARTDVTVHDYIKADFSVSNPVGCAPYEVTIDEYSSGGISNYYWDFDGDGVIDSTNVTGTFSRVFQNTTDATIVYPLTLIVENNDNCTDTLVRNIKVYPDVEPGFTMSLDEGCHPVQVAFTNNSTPSGDLNYTWNFGDGGSSNQDEPVHTFYNFSNTADSNYTVELIAVSDYYCADTTTQTVDIYHNPKAKMDINQTESCPPLDIVAQNQSTGEDNVTWYFDDGSPTQTDPNFVAHSYDNTTSNVLNHNLKLVTTTTNGCSDSTQLRLSVYPRVTADFGFKTDSMGCHPFNVEFRNESENANYYYWDFKDGVTSNLYEPFNRFENTTQTAKTYDVFMKATSEFNCMDSIERPVVVYPSPNAAFAVTPSLQVFPDATVSLDNNTNTGPWDYQWDFGDGNTSTALEPGTHTYDDWGEFKITLEAESAHCYDSVSHSIIIIAPEPIASFMTNPNEGCEPLTVEFTDNSVFAEDYLWDFDDGDTSHAVNPVHTYTEAGTYYVKQTVTSEGGESFDYQTIRVFQKPEANFKVEPKLVMLPDERAAFYNLSKYEDIYEWDFGDGATSNEESPKHLYREEGIYDVSLMIETFKGCRDTLVKEDIVEVVGKGKIQFPNAFTPSNSGPSDGRWEEGEELDELNDIFHPIGEGIIEYKLMIFNKWGEKIFESNDFNVGWDGYYMGEPLPQDVYIWKVEGKFSNGQTFEKMGDVTLIR